MTDTIAGELSEARRTGTRLSRERLLDLDATPAAAYRIQHEAHRLSGQPIAGWKLGATTTAGLKVFGLQEPWFAPVCAGDVYESGANVPILAAHEPLLECEFAVRLGADLPRDPSREDIARSIAAVHAAFEIVGCRFTGGLPGAGVLAIADGGLNQSVVIGPALSVDPVTRPDAIAVELQLDGTRVAGGDSACLLWADLVEAVAHLARHPELSSRGLRAGDVVLTGSCTGVVPVRAGQTATCRFGEAEISAVFVEV